MEITQQVAKAASRLRARFGTADERKQPSPPAAVLISRVITAAASPEPAADAADLRAALALVAADQWATESRELNLIKLARDRGMSWREIAWSLSLDSPQAAEKRFQRLARPPEALIYAFRVAESDDWHGKPNALPPGSYETGLIHFNPARPGPFQGHTLELRYGPVEEEVMPGPMRAYAQVNNRRIAVTALVQNTLFTSEIKEALSAAQRGGIREALDASQSGLGDALRAARGY